MYRAFQQTFAYSKLATETPEKGVKVNNKETRASDRHRIGTDKNTSFKSIDIMKPSLREKRSNTELFLSVFFCIWTEYGYLNLLLSQNTEKYGSEITPYLDTFHAVLEF